MKPTPNKQSPNNTSATDEQIESRNGTAHDEVSLPTALDSVSWALAQLSEEELRELFESQPDTLATVAENASEEQVCAIGQLPEEEWRELFESQPDTLATAEDKASENQALALFEPTSEGPLPSEPIEETIDLTPLSTLSALTTLNLGEDRIDEDAELDTSLDPGSAITGDVLNHVIEEGEFNGQSVAFWLASHSFRGNLLEHNNSALVSQINPATLNHIVPVIPGEGLYGESASSSHPNLFTTPQAAGTEPIPEASTSTPTGNQRPGSPVCEWVD